MALRAALPRGGALPERAWRARHRGICLLLWLHVVALVVLGYVRDQPLAVNVLGPAAIAAYTLAAMSSRLSRTTRSALATIGLLSSSALLIEFYDGLIEAHFHFFVTIAVVSLYQAWTPYLLAAGFVLVHHLVLGTMLPDRIYNHTMATHNPWLFAVIHGGAVLAESVACLVFWRVTEEAIDAERANGEALAQSNAELTRASRAVEDLVAMLSHDLRIPLAVLIGYSEMALDNWPEMDDEERLDFVRRVSRAGDSLHSMLEDTLAVSVLDGDGVVPRQAPVRVDEAVREALAALPDPVPAADLSGLRPVTADLDPGHLNQVLVNLLTNAVKYGGGSLDVSADADGETVFVRIQDHGAGVPAAFVPQLFDRFTRSDEARQGRQKGTGLGLYITRSLLLANAGDISYEPTPGGGATFCLQLPRAPRPAELLPA